VRSHPAGHALPGLELDLADHRVERRRRAAQPQPSAALIQQAHETHVRVGRLGHQPGDALQHQAEIEAGRDGLDDPGQQPALASLPATLGGLAFLSGGQRPEQATANLAALQPQALLWPLTFSFGRALVDPALAAWCGTWAGRRAGQRALAKRIAMNVAALHGRYVPELELNPA